MTKKLIIYSLILLGLSTVSFFGLVSAQTLESLPQFTSTTTPSTSISQRVWGRPIKITGLTTGLCLKLDSNSLLTTVACGSGGGGSGGTWATTTSQVSGQLINYSLNDTDIVTIGNSATTSAEYWFDPNTTTSFFKGKVGIATTSPYASLSVVGSTGVVADHYTATSTTATSTTPRLNSTGLDVDSWFELVSDGYFTSLLGAGLQKVSGALTLNATGDWTGTLDGIDGTALVQTSRTITLAGTANQITSSAGAQDLSANRTWTLSIPADFRVSSSTLGMATLLTNATTTSLAVTNLVSCDTIDTTADGSLKCGTDATGAGGGAFAWTPTTNFNQAANSTSTQIWLQGTPVSLSASSTANFNDINTKFATSTNKLVVSTSTVPAVALNSIWSNFGNFISSCESCGVTGANLLGIANYGSAAGAGINTWSARGSTASPSATQLNDDIYFMGGRGFGSTVWNTSSKAGIVFQAAENFTDTANGTYITIETTPKLGTTRTERVRIDSTGNVGIGSTTPQWTLQVASTTKPQITLTAGITDNHISFRNQGGLFVIATSSPLTFATSTSNLLEFDANGQPALPFLKSCDTIDTSATGVLSCGSDATGGGGSGVGTVSTSTTPTRGNLAYWTSSGAWPETLGTVATTSLTASSPLSLSQPISVLGGSASALSLSTAGDWTGTLDSIEGASIVQTSRTITVAGTANQITSSAGAQDLSANRTWTLSIPSPFIIQQASTTIFSSYGPAYFGATATSSFNSVGDLLVVGSTTLQNFTGLLATTTQATTTKLAISGVTSSILKTNANGTVGGISATGTVPMFNSFTLPDSGGNSWFQPSTINFANDNFAHLVGIASSTAAKTGFYGTFSIPQDFNGSVASVKVYWTSPGTANNAVFDLDYRAIGGDDTESLDQATFQESLTVTDANPSAAFERNLVTFDLAASNLAAGDTVEFYLARDGADANDNSAFDVEIHDVNFEYSK